MIGQPYPNERTTSTNDPIVSQSSAIEFEQVHHR